VTRLGVKNSPVQRLRAESRSFLGVKIMGSNATLTMGGITRVALAFTVMVCVCFCVRAQAESSEVSQSGVAEISCRLESLGSTTGRDAKTSVVCDYRHEPTFIPGQLALEVAGTKVKLLRENIKRYPAEGQKTALLAIFDVSDPRRGETTKLVYPKIVEALVGQRPAHLVFGVATFAQSLDTVFPLQPITPAAKLDGITFSATGAATELNRATLAALKKLSSEKADRRVLLVVSDGKAEDTAYKLADVVAEAKKFRIPIATVGISERPSETPSLQSLRLLADQSGGAFFDFSGKEVPADFRSRLLSPIEVGGRLSFDGSDFFGKRSISVILTSAEKKAITAKTEFNFPDTRGWQAKIKDFAIIYWWIFVSAVAVLAGVIWGAVRYRRTRRERSLQNRLVAEFRALDGNETRYEVRKSAVTIGRAMQNDIVITNQSVSGRHAELHRTREGGFRLSDLGSTNGTLVNETRITAVDLKDGDLVQLAEIRLQFKLFD